MKFYVIPTLVALSLGLCVTNCGSSPQPKTFQKRGLICKEDGFCLAHNDDDYFYGAFRAGERELQFKVETLHWSVDGFVKGSTGGRSHCLMTEYQHEFISGGMSCADDPLQSEAGFAIDHKDVAEKFLEFLETHEPAPHRNGEWETLKGMVRSTLNSQV